MAVFLLLTYIQCIYNMGEVCCICTQIYYSIYKNHLQYVFGHQPSWGNIIVKHVLTKQPRSCSAVPDSVCDWRTSAFQLMSGCKTQSLAPTLFFACNLPMHMSPHARIHTSLSSLCNLDVLTPDYLRARECTHFLRRGLWWYCNGTYFAALSRESKGGNEREMRIFFLPLFE